MLNLSQIIKQVAKEENFQLKKIEDKYKKHYQKTDRSQGDRCVDDRKTTHLPGYPYDQGEYNGRQFAGGTFGIIGALRVVAKVDEKKARTLVKQLYQENNWRLGDHIDDKHGEITNAEKLKNRIKGCGNQDAIKQGKVPMYKKVSQQTVENRFQWLKKNNGYLPVLHGGHHAKGAAVNLVQGETFNPEQAVDQEESIFNLDLAESILIAEKIHPKLETNLSREEFTRQFTVAVARDYLQTLTALNGPSSIQVKK